MKKFSLLLFLILLAVAIILILKADAQTRMPRVDKHENLVLTKDVGPTSKGLKLSKRTWQWTILTTDLPCTFYMVRFQADTLVDTLLMFAGEKKSCGYGLFIGPPVDSVYVHRHAGIGTNAKFSGEN